MPLKKFHIAISVDDVQASVVDYVTRLQAEPVTVIPNEYALWRTSFLNFSIRKDADSTEKGLDIVELNGGKITRNEVYFDPSGLKQRSLRL